MYNEQATKEYINTHFEIQAEIEKLQDALSAHNQTTGHIHWAHVGDIKHILSQLKQINGEEN